MCVCEHDCDLLNAILCVFLEDGKGKQISLIPETKLLTL